MIIETNYFSGKFSRVADENNLTIEHLLDASSSDSKKHRESTCISNRPFCLDYIQAKYGIDKTLWLKSYHLFEYANNFWFKPKPFEGCRTAYAKSLEEASVPIPFEGQRK
jgi:hypothetical protein